MTTEEWVYEVNTLAAEMDELAVSLHPSVWPEQLADLVIKYEKLCKRETRDEEV